MLHLIKKDLMIQKLSWLLYFAMLTFFMFFNKDLFFVIGLISSIVAMNAFYYDEQANGHKLWNSLPFTRKEIVSARYLSLIVITFIIALFALIVEGIMNGGWSSSIWKELIGGMILLMLSAGLCFPLLYAFAQRSMIFTLFIFFILFVIAAAYGLFYSYQYLTDHITFFQTINMGVLWSLAFIVSLCWYLFSWGISIKIYRAKELI